MKKSFWIILLAALLVACADGFSSEDVGFNSGVSQGGSLARFSIVDEYLYIVNDFSIIPIEISDLSNPVVNERVDLGIGIETIFPYQGHLYIGSSDAMYIYDISDPSRPDFRSVHFHATGCDPVVVSGDYAYVTLREGNACGARIPFNMLEVLNVSDVRNPILLNQVEMTSPRGLAVGCDNSLFVCEGPGGLVHFDLTDPTNPVFVERYDQYAANDLIIQGDLMIVTGEDGVYQYSCATDSLQLLSFLPFSL